MVLELKLEIEAEKVFSFSEWMEKAESHPFKCFDCCPVKEIRAECLRILNRDPSSQRPNQQLVEWAERRIATFLEAHQREVWEPLLQWYLFRAVEEDIVSRAVEFAVDIAEKYSSELPLISKLVIGRIRYSDDQGQPFYWLPSVRRFLKKLLAEILPKTWNRDEYSEEEWYCAERAVCLITVAEDVTFLPEIEQLFLLHGKGEIKPRESETRRDIFCQGQRSNLLQQAVKRLQEARAQQCPDLNATLGSYLRNQAGLIGSVVVHLRYSPHSSFPAGEAAEKTALVRVELELTNPDEKEKLLPVLEHLSVGCWPNGFVQAKVFKSEALDRYTPSARFTNCLSCEFTLILLEGMNRFWLFFEEDSSRQEIVRTACYIQVDAPEPSKLPSDESLT